jgi:hypothetical protein
VSLALAVRQEIVVILDYQSRQPMGGVVVEITSEVLLVCVRAPCPSYSKQSWQGTTDREGVLRYPLTLEGPDALLYAHLVGSSFAADVYGDGRRDSAGRPIVRLKRPVASADTGSQDRAQPRANNRP